MLTSSLSDHKYTEAFVKLDDKAVKLEAVTLRVLEQHTLTAEASAEGATMLENAELLMRAEALLLTKRVLLPPLKMELSTVMFPAKAP